jgi:hypothetical protein
MLKTNEKEGHSERVAQRAEVGRLVDYYTAHPESLNAGLTIHWLGRFRRRHPKK